MPSFSSKSHNNLTTCDPRLQRLFNEVIRHYDCTIIEGHRTKGRQQEMFLTGRSKAQWPDSKHNTSPAMAVDAAPYIADRGIPWPKVPGDWRNSRAVNAYLKDVSQFYHFAGFVEGVAKNMKLTIRWGGDWDRDHVFSDQAFDDLVHFEIRN